MTEHTTGRTERTTRRTYLQRAAAVALAAAAGCLDGTGDGENGSDENGSDENGDDGENGTADLPAFPEVEDPPDAVYLPTHRESMRHLDPVAAGEYTLAPMLSYPHPFWTVTDGEIVQEVPENGTGVHLMFTVRDGETGVVLPVETGAEIRVLKDGERVDSPRRPWSMLSQEMGFHFGDNVPLEEDGTHTVEVTLPPLSVRLTGAFEGRFDETETAAFEFEYDDEFREAVVGGVEYLNEEEWGEPGALAPMGHGSDGHDEHGDSDDHEDGDDRDHGDGHEDHGDGRGDHGDDHDVPYSALPPAEAYPGVHLDPADPAADGLAESGDARFAATLLEPGARFVDGDERYLLISPRTPYNRVPIPELALAVTVDRDGETVADDESLVQTIDGEYGLHYGAALADVEPDDTVTIAIGSFPQVARHQGYETAFVEMPPIELTVPEGDE